MRNDNIYEGIASDINEIISVLVSITKTIKNNARQ